MRKIKLFYVLLVLTSCKANLNGVYYLVPYKNSNSYSEMHVKNDSVSLWGTKGYWISALVEYDRDSIRYTPFYKSLAEYGPEATLRNKLYKSLNLYGNTTVFGYEIHKDTLIEKYLDGNKNYNVKIKHTKPIISLKNKEEEAIFKKT